MYRGQLLPPVEGQGVKQRRPFRFGLRRMLLAFSAVAVLMGLAISVGPYLIAFFLFGEGPVWSRRSWPAELQALVNSDSARDEICGIRVYCVENFINEGYVWRFSIPQRTYTSLAKSRDNTNFSKLDPADRFWNQPPSWWTPNANANADFVAWHDLGQATTVITMYDKDKEVLYGFSYFDF
jgi:hypothetical protein